MMEYFSWPIRWVVLTLQCTNLFTPASVPGPASRYRPGHAVPTAPVVLMIGMELANPWYWKCTYSPLLIFVEESGGFDGAYWATVLWTSSWEDPSLTLGHHLPSFIGPGRVPTEPNIWISGNFWKLGSCCIEFWMILFRPPGTPALPLWEQEYGGI
jgi:hypothetical protein